MKSQIKWLVQISLVTAVAGSLYADDQPFWKAKSDVYKRIVEDRAVIVSAKSDRNQKDEKVVSLTTAGRIKAPLYFTNEIATDYADYKNILPYVNQTSFDTETQRLFASGSFMGFQSKVTVKITADGDEKIKHIRWEIMSGFLTGMKGVITEEQVKDEVTEVSMDAKYEGNISIPGFLMSWGFEFMGQKMAQAMRSNVEERWEKEQ